MRRTRRTTGRRLARAALVAVLGLTASLLGPLAPASAEGPSAEITAPGDGEIVVGPTTVTAAGDTGGPVAESIALLVDDVEVTRLPCTEGGATCSLSFEWDATGLPDAATVLTVELSADGAPVATSAPIAVEVRNPEPAVAITSPGVGDVRSGVVSVDASADIDPDLSETASSLTLLVDGSPVATVPCPAASSCAETLQWDATGETGGRTLTVELTTSRGRTALSPGVAITLEDPEPTVVVTAPSAGPVVGITPVSATATVAGPLTEFPATVVLLVDGSPYGEAFTCPDSERVCLATFSWDATGASGDVDLTAQVTTTRSRTATSDPVTVSAQDPEPSVSVTSPSSGSSVVGVTEVAVSGSVDAALTESVSQIEVFAGGVSVGVVDCVPAGSSCAGSVSWDATGAVGDVVLSAELTTTRSRTATSAPVTVSVQDPVPSVSVTSPSSGSSVVGVTEVAVSGSVDAALTESVSQIEVFAGGVSVGVVDCVPAGSSCAGSVSWDATGAVGDVVLRAELTTSRGRTATSEPVTVSAENPVPSVSISSPAAGSAVVGLVTVTLQASTDLRLTEHPTSIVLRDGAALVGTVTCGTTSTCAGPVTWDTTLLTGSRTLTATVTTDRRPAAATSAPVVVTAATPPPVVTITAPGTGAVVSGTSSAVTVSASTDARRTDVPRTVVLRVDGTARATATCAGSARTCTPTLRWDPSRYAGAHVLTVALTTSAGAVVVSAPRTVLAASEARVGVSRPRPVDHRALTTVTGRVLALTSGLPVAGVRVRLVLDPALGDTRTVTVRTDDRGRYALSFRPATRTQVRVRSLATTWLGGARATTTVDVRAPLTCSVERTRLAPGETGAGSCTAARLPVGTPLALSYVRDGRTVTFARGASRSSTIPFSFAFPTRGSYAVLVAVGRNALYARTVSRPLTVTVR